VNQHSLAYLVAKDGALIQLKEDKILPNFKSYNVLLFYSAVSKSLYNWVGIRADSQILEHIEEAENLILGMHPEMKVLRHLIIKESADMDNLKNMLEDIGIRYSDYEERMRLWREFEISVYADIQKLKIKENNLLMVGKLTEAIEVDKKIVESAKKIQHTSLIAEKQEKIENLSSKVKETVKNNALLSEINLLILQLKNAVLGKDIENAVSIYNEIILLYKTVNQDPSPKNQKILKLFFYTRQSTKIHLPRIKKS
jgi:hypothetical protein